MKYIYTLIFALCTAGVLIADNELRSIYIDCPDDAYADCDDELWDLSIYGSPHVTSAHSYRIDGPHESRHLNSCGVGHVKRSWTIYDHYDRPYYCHQKIHVSAGSNSLHIDWPHDYTTEECGAHVDPDDLPAGFDRPIVSDPGDCASIAISYTDQEFHISGDACKKILRTWKVVDWCIYEPRSNPDYGIYRYVQIIKIKTSEIPVISCPADVTIGAGDDCTGAEVQLDLATASSTCAQNLVITNDSPFAINNGADASGFYPLGSFWVTFTVKDGCGNQETCKTKITVVDEKKPIVYCDHGIVTTLGHMQDGYYAKIWPDRFDEGSSDNCTEKEDLKFSVTPDFFTCDELGRNKIWFSVEDESGNVQTCETYVIIQDNMGMCPDSANLTITGSLSTNTTNGIRDIPVYLNNNRDGMSMTADNGNFAFYDLMRGESYDIRPLKRDKVHDGLNVMDVLILLKHLTNTKLIDDPSILFSADVDDNGVINILDLYNLRNVVMGINDRFPSNLSWKFIYNLDETEAFTFEELHDLNRKVSVDTFREALTDLTFTGFKIGDLNGDNSYNGSVETRTTSNLFYSQNGKDLIIDFDKMGQVSAAQFALKIDGQYTIDYQAYNDYEGWQVVQKDNGILYIQFLDLTGSRYKPFVLSNVSEDLTITLSADDYEPLYITTQNESVALEWRSKKLGELAAEDVQVFPNPAQDILTVNAVDKIDHVRIIDAYGRVVIEQDMGNQQLLNYSLNISELISGQYLIQIGSEGKDIYRKIIKL